MIVLTLLFGMLKQIKLSVALPLVLGIGALAFAYYKGFSEADARWQARQKAAIAEQLVAANKAEVAAEGETNALQLQNDALTKKVSDYETIISKAPKGDVCRLSAADLQRLRKLRGR